MHNQGLSSHIVGFGVEVKRLCCLAWLGAGVLTPFPPNKNVKKSLVLKSREDIAGLAGTFDVFIVSWTFNL